MPVASRAITSSIRLNDRIKSYHSTLRQAESAGCKQGDNKLDKVEYPTVQAKHGPVHAFQVPAIVDVKVKVRPKVTVDN